MDLMKIDAKDYGLDENKAKEVAGVFAPMLAKMVELEDEFNEVVKLEMSEDKISLAKELRLKYVKVRTGTATIHKETKAFYLQGGKFVDGWKNAQLMASQGIEEKLMSIEKHYENIEKERISKLQIERSEALMALDVEVIPENLGDMQDVVWNNFLAGTKLNYDNLKKAELEAEEQRISKEKAEAEEQKRIREENEKLKKEAEEKDRIDKIESDKRAKIEAERVSKEFAESEKRRKSEEARIKKENDEAEKRRKVEDERIKKEKQERESLQKKINNEKIKRENAEAELRVEKEAPIKVETVRFIVESIQKCKDSLNKDGHSPDYKNGFVAGLEHVLKNENR